MVMNTTADGVYTLAASISMLLNAAALSLLGASWNSKNNCDESPSSHCEIESPSPIADSRSTSFASTSLAASISASISGARRMKYSIGLVYGERRGICATSHMNSSRLCCMRSAGMTCGMSPRPSDGVSCTAPE